MQALNLSIYTNAKSLSIFLLSAKRSNTIQKAKHRIGLWKFTTSNLAFTDLICC